MTRLIRIVVPTLNSDATLGATLESLRPSLPWAEVVIVDGYSTDRTSDIASAFGVPVLQVPPGNMYTAINHGLTTCTLPWITYINSDDILYTATLHERLRTAKDDDAVLYGTVDFIDSEGRFLRSYRPARPRGLLPLYQAGYSPLLQQGTVMRTPLFTALGGFDERYRLVADADLWFRALSHGARFRMSPRVTVAAFRLHANQLSQRCQVDMRNEERLMRAEMSAKTNGLALWEFTRWRVANLGSVTERFLRARRLGLTRSLCRNYEVPKLSRSLDSAG